MTVTVEISPEYARRALIMSSGDPVTANKYKNASDEDVVKEVFKHFKGWGVTGVIKMEE